MPTLTSPTRRRFWKAALAAALLGATAAAYAQKDDAKPVPPKTNATFGILQFDAGSQTVNESWYSSRFEIMNGVAEMMTTAMVEQGYRLIERQRLGEILKEQDLGASGRIDPATAAKLGKVIGCDYIIIGTVTQFGVSRTGGDLGNVLGRVTNVGVNQTKGEATIDVRIVNSTTGEIVAVGKGGGRETSTSFQFSIDWWKSVDFHNSEWEGSLIGKAARKAVDECIKKIDPKAAKLPALGLTPPKPKARYTVVAVTSSTEAVIDMDPKFPLKVGDVLNLRRVTNVVKKDGKVIFEESKIVGTVSVVEVQDAGAKVRMVGSTSETIKEGDIVEPQS